MQFRKPGRMRSVWKLGVAVGLFVTTSCSASWHMKRAVAKDPSIVADTIVRVDTTIVTKAISVTDTLVVRDTITRDIVRDGVKIKIKRIHDTIRVDVICPPDTIQIIEEVNVDRVVYKRSKRSTYDHIEMILFMLILLVIALALYRFTKAV